MGSAVVKTAKTSCISNVTILKVENIAPGGGEDSDSDSIEENDTCAAFNKLLRKYEEKCQSILNAKPNYKTQQTQISKEFAQGVFRLESLHFKTVKILQDGRHGPMVERLNRIGELICRTGALDVLCDFLADCLKKWDFFKDDESGFSYCWTLVKSAVFVIWSYSGTFADIKRATAKHEKVISVFVDILGTHAGSHAAEKLSSKEETILTAVVEIMRNIVALEDNHVVLRRLNIVDTIQKYVNSPRTKIRLSSISILAGLMNELEAYLLRYKHVEIFSYIVTSLENAWCQKVHHMSEGWSVEELARIVKQLARLDTNKQRMLEKGCLPILTKIISKGKSQEVQEALTCVWHLAFEETNKPNIHSEPGLVAAIKSNHRSLSESGKRACDGILWIIEDQEFTQKIKGGLDDECSRGKFSKSDSSDKYVIQRDSKFKGHVLISYHRRNKASIKKICEELRSRDIPVWVDIDNEDGSALQTMVQAVEDSCAMVVAMSQWYKDSPRNRTEVEFAIRQRKPIILLNLQTGYNPDGWLGQIRGVTMHMYFDFSESCVSVPNIGYLAKALYAAAGVQLEELEVLDDFQDVDTTVGAVHSAPSRTPRQPIDEQKVEAWSKQDVHRWLAKHEIDGFSSSFPTLSVLSGVAILYMHNLQVEAPEMFHKSLKEELKIYSLEDRAKASEAFKDLSID